MNRQQLRKLIIIVAFLLFPAIMHWLSPWTPLFSAAAGVFVGAFITFSLQFLSSLFFGRVFCGWLCPGGGLQECLILASDKRAKVGKRDLIKWFIWFPWLALIIVLFIRAGGIAYVIPLFGVPEGLFLGHVNGNYRYFIYYGVVFGTVILVITFGKRTFCHSVCWMAPFMIIGTKISQLLRLPRLHLEPTKENCNGCNICSRKCIMSLDVKEMVEREDMRNAECILCGECVDACPQKAIQYSFKR